MAAPSSHSAPSVITTTRHLSPGSLGTMTLGAGVLAAMARRAAPRRNAVARRALTGALRHRATPVTARHATTVVAPPEEILGIKPDEKYNVPAGVREKLGKNLLLNEKLGNYNCDKLELFFFVCILFFWLVFSCFTDLQFVDFSDLTLCVFCCVLLNGFWATLKTRKHPLGILWKSVQDYFAEQDPNCILATDSFFESGHPIYQ